MAKNTKPPAEFTAQEDAGLLECVRRTLRNVPAGKVKSYLEHRMISVDGVVTSRFDHPVKRGQRIRISRGRPALPAACPAILYEDEVLLAVNKPAGLLTVATDTEKEKTAYRFLKDSLGLSLYVVHRLDRDTSGVLLFAKSAETRDALQQNWSSTLRREYLAVCEGVFDVKKGRCDTVLRETANHMVYSVPFGEGKRAVTHYEVIEENREYSLLRVLLETGRKNQIRVHMKELSHPVVGDKKYGASTDPLGRLGLHARVLEILHPVSHTPLALTAEAGSDFTLPGKPKRKAAPRRK